MKSLNFQEMALSKKQYHLLKKLYKAEFIEISNPITESPSFEYLENLKLVGITCSDKFPIIKNEDHSVNLNSYTITTTGKMLVLHTMEKQKAFWIPTAISLFSLLISTMFAIITLLK